MHLGQDLNATYAQAQQYGTFEMNVDATGDSLPLPYSPSVLAPTDPGTPTAPLAPFPWWLLIAAIVLIAVSKE